jgi:hypothetical protein
MIRPAIPRIRPCRKRTVAGEPDQPTAKKIDDQETHVAHQEVTTASEQRGPESINVLGSALKTVSLAGRSSEQRPQTSVAEGLLNRGWPSTMIW